MAGLFDMLTPESRGVVPRNMQQVAPGMKEVFGERVPNKSLPSPSGSSVAKSAGRVGPLAGLLAGYEGGSFLADIPGKMSRGIDQMKAKAWTQDNPEEAAAAQEGMEGMANRAVQSGASYARDMTRKGQELNSRDLLMAVPQTAPQAPQDEAEAQQAQAVQIESQRQTIEAGAKEQLRSNQLSRPKAAQAVVEADVARTGETLSPEAMKSRVAEETSAMRSMDNDQLSKYISYAIIGAGVIAGVTDDSGQAAGMFFDQMNKAQARGDQQKAAATKAAATKAENDRKAEQEERKIAQGDRRLATQEAAAATDAMYKEGVLGNNERKTSGLLDKWANDKVIAQQKLDAYRDRTAKAAVNGKTPTGPAMSYKDNKELVESNLKARGIKADKGVVEAAAQQLQNLQKNNPELTVDEQLQRIGGQFAQDPGSPASWWDFTGITESKPKIRLK